MFKLVVLSVLIAVAAAAPGHFETPLVYSAPATVAVHEHGLANVGAIVKSVPSSVSHSSSSVVHSSAHVVEDVLAPAVKTTYAAPAPVVHTSYAAAAPLVHTSYAAATPLVKSYAAAPLYKTYAASPYLQTAYAAPAYTSYAGVSPLSYTSTGVW